MGSPIFFLCDDFVDDLVFFVSFNDFGVFFAAPPRLVSWPTSLLFSFTLLVLTADGLFFGVAISKNPGGGVENPFLVSQIQEGAILVW